MFELILFIIILLTYTLAFVKYGTLSFLVSTRSGNFLFFDFFYRVLDFGAMCRFRMITGCINIFIWQNTEYGVIIVLF